MLYLSCEKLFFNAGIAFYSFNYWFSQSFGNLRIDTFNVYAKNIGVTIGLNYFKNFYRMNVGVGLSYQLFYSKIHHVNLTENKIVQDYPCHQLFEGVVNGVIPPAPKKTINNVMALKIDLTIDYKITNSINILLDNKISFYGASYTD